MILLPCIVNPQAYKTKKSFKQAVKDGIDPMITDPSIFDPFYGRLSEIIEKKGEITVTNHPKRSWFARVYKSKRNGRIIVQ